MPIPVRRLIGHPIRNSAWYFARKPIRVNPQRPLISFTFDDFPRTALSAGGEILARYGARGTYYVSMGRIAQDSPSGQLMTQEDLRKALEDGHELGCHTFSHLHSWQTSSAQYEDSVRKNGEALRSTIPGAKFESFSYPLSEPSPANKKAICNTFECCRSGGQTFNTGSVDRNQLNAFFLEMAHGDLNAIKAVIDTSNRRGGWIIFATHDIAPNPSRYGCTPEFFEQVVQYSVSSGAQVLPVVGALRTILQSKTR